MQFNILQLRPLFKIITQETINDNDYNESLNCFEFIQTCERKNEPITNLNIITSSTKAKLPLNRNENCYQIIWNDMDELLKPYQDVSPRHKALWSFANRLKMASSKNEQSVSNKMDFEMSVNNLKKKTDEVDYELENQKLSKRKKFPKESLLTDDAGSVLDFWSKVLNENGKTRLEFFGRKANPNVQIVPLYSNLKLDENPSKGGAKIEIS